MAGHAFACEKRLQLKGEKFFSFGDFLSGKQGDQKNHEKNGFHKLFHHKIR